MDTATFCEAGRQYCFEALNDLVHGSVVNRRLSKKLVRGRSCTISLQT